MKKKQAEVTEETKTVQKEEEKAVKQKIIADELQAECQAELDKAMPELNEAEKAMGTITPASISILAKMDSPPEELKPVAKALCIILILSQNQYLNLSLIIGFLRRYLHSKISRHLH